MKIYLLEAYHPDVTIDEGSLVIALTPLVCYQLDKAGMDYSIIEDYYDRVELAAREDGYHQSQLQWIAGLDAFLQENIEEVKKIDLKLGTVYYYYLKTAVLDPIYLHSYTLRKLFAAVKPTAFTFVSRSTQEIPPDFTIYNSGRSYYARVAEVLTRQENIPMESIFLEPDVKNGSGTTSQYGGFQTRIRRALVKSSWVKKVFFYSLKLRFFFKCLRNYFFAKRTGQKRLNIFLLRLGHIGIDFVIEALKKGHTVYQLSGESITRYACFGSRKYFNIKSGKTGLKVLNDEIWENTASLLEHRELIKQLNRMCQLDVSGILLPQLKHFISRVCPQVYNSYQSFTYFFLKAKIDFVITPSEVIPADFGAIAATSHHQGTKSVNLIHGDTVFAVNLWDIIWLSRFDIVISTNEETREYFRRRCQVNHFTTGLYLSPHRLLPIKRRGSLREKTGKKVKKDRVIYLPTMFVGEYYRYDCAHYPDTWYYGFQKALIEYFSARKEYTFVWKGLPGSDTGYNPIPVFIKDNNYENIEIATNPFIQHLLTADRVICDYPSTGFYESVVAGISTISVYHRSLKIRKSAKIYFGKLLVPFSDVSEAIQHIDEFLGNDPELYKMTLDMEGKGVLDILEEIGREEAE